MLRRLKKGAAEDSRAGLSIDDSRVSFASVHRRKDGTLGLAAAVIEEGADDPGKKLQLAARMDTVDPRGSKVTAVLPDATYQVLLLELPNVPEDEVNDAALWQVKDLLDFPVGETVVEVFGLPRQAVADGKPIGYAVAARRRSIQEYVELFTSANLPLDAIDIPELCQRNIATLLPQDQDGVAFLHLTQHRGILTITRQGVLYLVRQIENGRSALQAAETGEFAAADLEATGGLDFLQEPDEKPEADNFIRNELVNTIVQEIQRSLDFFDSHYDCPPVSELVLSPGSNVGGLAKSLNDQLGIAVSSLNLNKLFDMQAEISDIDQGACMLAVGGALRTESMAA